MTPWTWRHGQCMSHSHGERGEQHGGWEGCCSLPALWAPISCLCGWGLWTQDQLPKLHMFISGVGHSTPGIHPRMGLVPWEENPRTIPR